MKVSAPGGAQLAATIEGEGPDLVLVHAGVADARMWQPLVARVRARFRTIRYDARGTGQSTSPAGAFAPHDDLLAVFDAAGVERATLVGASFGGYVSLDFTLAHPDRVERLVLLDPPRFDQAWSQRMEDFDAAETAALEAGDLDRATEVNVELWATPASADLVRAMQRRAFEVQRAAPLEPQEVQPEATTRLDEIVVPTIVAHGTEDVEDFQRFAKLFAEEIAGAKLVAIEGARHLPALEKPDEVAALL